MSTFSRKSREVLHDFNFFSVVRDTIHESSTNKEVVRHSIAHIGATAIVPVMDNGDIVLIKQYRGSIDQLSLEAVAGRLDVENEELATCALRELTEEVGITAAEVISLGFVHTSPGFEDEKIYLFMATNCSELENNEPDGLEEQFAETIRVPMKQALVWINDGTITDAKSIIIIYRTAKHLGLA